MSLNVSFLYVRQTIHIDRLIETSLLVATIEYTLLDKPQMKIIDRTIAVTQHFF